MPTVVPWKRRSTLRQLDRQSLQPGEELVHERLARGRLLLDYELTGLLVEERRSR